MLELPRFGDPVTISRTSQLEARLHELLQSLPEIEGAAVVSPDGLAIASVLAAGIEEDRVAAMSAAMVSLGERIARELGRGTMEQVYVRGAAGHAVLTAAGPQAVLTVMARNDVRLGMLLLELRKSVADLQAHL
ncbi:MAG: roadblock/LC7 domain-containing protein [Anaerolineales bacterium]|nr:roadblock/LC7 domain-containing protein [Anaerolineales bacterium]